MINEFPNYRIERDGQVKNIKRGNYLKQQTDKHGYYIIRLGLSRTYKKTLKIHRLLAIAYIPNPHNYKEVDHKNRDRTDNRIENLRWASHSEQQKNKGVYKNSISGHQYIYKIHSRKYRLKIEGVIDERFRTLKEAIEKRDSIIHNKNTSIG